MSRYRLGTASKAHLSTTSNNMQSVVRFAITLTDVDFSVVDGERSHEEQLENIENGVSWTMDSDHIHTDEREDTAVDIYPWADGRTSMDPEHFKRVAKAMFAAACYLKVSIEWGGFWRGKQYDPAHWAETRRKYDTVQG